MLRIIKYHLIFLIYSCLAAQIIPRNDIVYEFLRYEFRLSHELSIYKSPYPFKKDIFNNFPYSDFQKNFYSRVLPSFKIWNNTPEFKTSFWAYYNFDKFSLTAEPLVVNDMYGELLIGEKYSRLNMSGRFQTALIEYDSEYFTFQVGRAPLWWGQSWESSIIISGDSPPFDYFKYQLKSGRLTYTMFAGQLHSAKADSIGRFKRFIGGKKLTYVSESEKFILSLGDLILYTGLDRSLELYYLNPFVPTFFADLEKETGHYPWDGLDQDNAMIFFDGRYVFNKPFSIFFEFFVDDFQITLENRGEIPDALAYKIGADGLFKIFSLLTTFEFEYTRIFGNTYITRGWFTNWEDRNIPIGYKYGPDCESLNFLIDYWQNDKIRLSTKITYLEKGSLTLESDYDQYGKSEHPSAPVDYHTYFSPEISIYHKYGLFQFGSMKDFNSIDGGSFYLNIILIMGIGFNI